jgi:hypothetical protein
MSDGALQELRRGQLNGEYFDLAFAAHRLRAVHRTGGAEPSI